MSLAPKLPIDSLRNALEGSYTIDRELGRGGMSAVFLAQDCKHGRAVAIKVLHPELAASVGPERFLQEIQLAARLNHPHILGLYDSGSVDGLLYYVMPYVEGESLRERLDRQQLMSIDEAVHHGRAIASALDYANRQGVVHRDVKPENVMLYEGEAMVMDFGIAKAMSNVGSETLTQTGMMVGTPAYVSPEQAAGDLNLDGRSDQYSLGCMMYEMLTGERPFSGATPQAVMTKRFTETPRPVRALRAAVPESIERAVSKAMATEPNSRFTSTGQFRQALVSGSMSTPSDTMVLPQQSVSAAKSVAVLPFANMSNDPENEYFTDGMAEELINALSKIQALRVASRTSSFSSKGKDEDIAEIGRRLKVSTVLEGSVRKMGNKLRITAQLVNVADGYHLWSERYDRELEDVFAIQDDISQSIVAALRVILTEDEKKKIEQPRAVNVEAYDFYLRGRQAVTIRRKSLELARRMFEKAISIDPTYARAHAGLAECCALLYTYCDSRQSNLREAVAASKKALELEGDLAEAHVARGLALSLGSQYEEAETEFEIAMKLDPKLFDAVYWYASARMSQGRFEEAIKLLERAVVLRPEDYQSPGFMSLAYTSLGMHEESTKLLKRHMKLVEEHLELYPDDPRAAVMGAISAAALGDTDAALQYLDKAIKADPEDSMILYNAACAYSTLGRIPEALDSLERAVRFGWADKGWLEHDSDLGPLRSEPRYQALINSL